MARFDRAASASAREDARASFEEEPEQSGLFQSFSPARSLSLDLWDLDFAAELPCAVSHEGVEAVSGELDRMRGFLAREFPSLTEEGLGREPSEAAARAKALYVCRLSDLIELRQEDTTVGVLIGSPEDWATYYVRIFAVLPRFQRPTLLRRFIKDVLFRPLREHGVERVVAETSPANIAMSRLLTELRFHVTGHKLTDRWGALVRYTKFLDADCEAAFMQSFAGTAPVRPGRVPRKEEGT